MIRTVVFDIGNVLISWDWKEMLRSMQLPREEIDALGRAVFLHEDWNEMDRGVMTEDEILRRFQARVPQYADELKDILHGIYRRIPTCAYTRSWITALKEHGYRVYYLSNYGSFTREYSREALSFTELMDGGLFSYEVQMLKPNRWIFAELCRRFGINPQEAVFLDDNAANVAAAKEMGFFAIRFTSYEESVEELKKLGVH